MKRRLIVLVFIVSLCAKAFAQAKIVVGITVENLRQEYLQLFWNEFSTGGFKKLMAQGTQYEDAYYAFKKTDSSADYAAISTSASPFENGIAAEFYYDRAKRDYVSIIADSKVEPLGCDRAFSAANLASPTLSDRLFERTYGLSKIVSVALTPQAAILQNGHAGQAYWINNLNGQWASSSYYVSSLPAWVKSANKATNLGKYCDKTWQLLFPVGYYFTSRNTKYGFSYDVKTECAGLKYYDNLLTVPFANDFVCDFVIKAIENEGLGKDLVPDMLFVGLAVNPFFKQNSAELSIEMEDAYLRLDKCIEKLLSALSARFSDSEFIVYLVGARTSSPSTRQAFVNKNLEWKAFGVDRYYALLSSYLKGIYGKDNMVEKFAMGNVYLNHKVIDNANLDLIAVQKTAAEFLLLTEGVKSVATAVDLAGVYSSGVNPGIAFSRRHSGDVVYTLQTNYYEENIRKQLTGFSQGYEYPVPLFLYGRNVSRSKTESSRFDIGQLGMVVEGLIFK